NRRCGADTKINTAHLRIGVVAQIQKLILHWKEYIINLKGRYCNDPFFNISEVLLWKLFV
ncbi:MAG: hypothetical protein KIB50_02995, partial [Ureaplasma parvum]